MNRDFEKMTDEELALASQTEKEGTSAGDAGEVLFHRYRWLIESKTKTYFIIGAGRDDVIQEGMIGLYKAMKDYRPDKNASFRTFADMCINRQILSAIKAANRKKHYPLNESMSIFDPISGTSDNAGDDKQSTLEDVLATGNDFDPQVAVVLGEIVDYIIGNEDGTFSDLELKVWNSYIGGKSKQEIAEALSRSPKSIDNALQRMKKKIIKYMYE